MANDKNRHKVKSTPHIPRLIESSNDVEKNPGPPKVIKNGVFPGKDKNGSSKSQTSHSSESLTKSISNGSGNGAATASDNTKKLLAITNGDTLNTGPMNNIDEIRQTIERQAETIRQQRTELEALRKQMEKNFQIQQDFQSELSEIRKNWQILSDGGKINAKGTGTNSDESIHNKLETLATAYNDIQDRLYEIDKSWKNNLMIYGVPYTEGEEEDTVITEEKVSIFLLWCIWIDNSK